MSAACTRDSVVCVPTVIANGPPTRIGAATAIGGSTPSGPTKHTASSTVVSLIGSRTTRKLCLRPEMITSSSCIIVLLRSFVPSVVESSMSRTCTVDVGGAPAAKSHVDRNKAFPSPIRATLDRRRPPSYPRSMKAFSHRPASMPSASMTCMRSVCCGGILAVAYWTYAVSCSLPSTVKVFYSAYHRGAF
jgi:hypothetical protein